MTTVDRRTLMLGSLASLSSVGVAERTSAGPHGRAPTSMGAAANVPVSDPLNLVSPPAAQTADSIALVWDLPAGAVVEGYSVYVDGKLVATTKHTDHTVYGLQPSKGYDMVVHAHIAGGARLVSGVVRLFTKRRPKIHDISRYGAVGDGVTLNTLAIQRAVTACAAGDMVRIPKGVFVSGAIFLQSDMTLHLDEGAILLGSTETQDYPLLKYRFEGREQVGYASLVGTPDARGKRWRNIAITGTGTINGNGVALRERQVTEKAGVRGRVISIRDTDGVYLQGFTVRQSPSWCVHPVYCTGLTVNGVSIHTKYDEAGKPYAHMVNGDGLDPDSCRDVCIVACHIASQDDCIAIKSGRDAEGRAVGIPSQNVRISNCRFTSGFGVAIGSEMAGGVHNVLVDDCVFENTFGIASVKAPRGRGSVIENVVYRNCTLKNHSDEHQDGRWFRGAIYVDQFYGVLLADPHAAEPKDQGTPLIRNIIFQNITLETVGGNAIYLAGLPESPLDGIQFENVVARGVRGFVAYNVEGLNLGSLSVEADSGKAMNFVNVRS